MAASQKEVVVGEFAFERDTKNFKVFTREDDNGGRKATEYVSPDNWKALGEPSTISVVLRVK